MLRSNVDCSTIVTSAPAQSGSMQKSAEAGIERRIIFFIVLSL
jgi:hypothetical protein